MDFIVIRVIEVSDIDLGQIIFQDGGIDVQIRKQIVFLEHIDSKMHNRLLFGLLID